VRRKLRQCRSGTHYGSGSESEQGRSARMRFQKGSGDRLATTATMEVVSTPANQDSAARVGALCKKIAALDSLAANGATTPAESESAQNAAQRLRLQLHQLIGATEATPSLGQPPEPSVQGSASGPDSEPLGAAPSGATRLWLWLLPGVALVGVLLVLFWPRGNGSAVSSNEPPPRTQGVAAAAEAQRACRIRDLVKEFQKTPGGTLHSNEDAVDVRRRCGAYLSVRGFDEEACFPSVDGKPFPECPTAE
jgi:hypothetical protein